MNSKPKISPEQQAVVQKLNELLQSVHTMQTAKEYGLTYKQTLALAGLKSGIGKFLRNLRYQDEYDVMIKLIAQMRQAWEGNSDMKPMHVTLEDGRKLSIGASEVQSIVNKIKTAEPLRNLVERIFEVTDNVS